MTLLFPVPLPEVYIKKAQELGIDPSQISEQFIRGSGKGGQKINKSSTCVQLLYPPLGIEIKCQSYREQSKNRLSAWKLLIDKIEYQVKGQESEKAKQIYKLIKQKRRRSKRAKEKILAMKKMRSELKKTRAKPSYWGV